MRYSLTPIHCRPWLVNGLSLKLIESQYENNYGGALRRLNAITAQLESLDFASTPGHVINGLKRDELIALNSTLLHELYFASVAFGDGKPTDTFAQARGAHGERRDRGLRFERACGGRPSPVRADTGGNAMTTIGFDRDALGSLPADWAAGVTGRGNPRWIVEQDPGAPSAPNVLKQTGSGDFPWCVRKDKVLADGFVEVKFKPLSGREDQAGGIVWRWKDGNSYYVARANALENNVSLYYTENGSRKTIQYVKAPVAGNAWHVLRAEFRERRIRVLLDGKAYIELDDAHISGPGAIGVWTKADSVTAFDDFSFGP